MYLPKNSFVHSIPCNVEKTQVLLIEGMRLSCNMVITSFLRLQSSLVSIEQNDFHDYAPYFLDAWSIIDSANRFDRLREKLRNSEILPDPKKSNYTNILRKTTAFRNSFQHLEERIVNEGIPVNEIIPIFWVIKWLNVQDSKTILSHIMISWAPRKDMFSAIINPLWKKLLIWVNEISLESFDRKWKRIEIVLDDIIAAVRFFLTDLELQLHQQLPPDTPCQMADFRLSTTMTSQ